MEYLYRVLGIRVTYLEDITAIMPNYIVARYRIKKVVLDGRNAVFVYPKEEIESISAVKKHFDRIEKTTERRAVLILDHLTYRQKEYLLRDHIPFVVDRKQIYLPFMALYLQERCDSEKKETDIMLPSAQLLLLYFIYHGCGELITSEAVKALSFTATSISRASRQLEEMGLIQTEKRGVQKVIYSDKTPEELFTQAKKHMENPVKRTIFVPRKELHTDFLLSGYSALAEYTMINLPTVKCIATERISGLVKKSSERLQNSDDQYEVELWRYDPKKLTNGRRVDRLSLALELGNDRDERIEGAVEEMLKQVWSDIDGQRD